MEKLKMRTQNITDTNLQKLAELFPNCFSETYDQAGEPKKVIDFDMLKQELSSNIVDGSQERYQLNWVGKREALLTANAPIAKTLRPCRIESVDFDKTQNLYIEGDNLDALKLLKETYLGKVKMIYIDPPYNTGNDFIYEDDFAEDLDEFLKRSNQKDDAGNNLIANTDSNGRFHSDWLTMMYSRLRLARTLLKDDGVIFLSIDENEIFNLRSLCNEVFGESNFLTELIIKVRHENRILKGDKDFHETCEYCLMYRKSDSYNQVKRIVDNTSIEKYIYSIEVLSEPLETFDCDGKIVEVYPPNSYRLVKSEVSNEDYFQLISIRGSLKEGNSSGRFFMKHLDRIKENYSYLYKVPNMGNDKYDYRYFIRPATENHANGAYLQGVPLDKQDTKEIPFPNYYDFVNEFNNVGYEGGIEFRSGKKPQAFLLKLMELAGLESSPNAVILDFFAGSSSSAEACLRFNSSYGGNRKFVMIQIPENLDETLKKSSGATKTTVEKTISILDEIGKPHNLAEIGKERIRRAGKKVKEDNPNAINLDIGFRVLKVDTSNMSDVFYNPDFITQDLLSDQVENIKLERTSEDLLFQVLLDWGVDLTLPISRETIADKEVFIVAEDALAACFDNDITEDCLKAIANKHPLRVVFRDSGFSSDSVKINVEQIFKLISPSTDVKTI